jgi:hypothetical protein
VIFLAIALKITSWIFIARSAVALSNRSMPTSGLQPLAGAAQERTFHVLVKADTSCATDTDYRIS